MEIFCNFMISDNRNNYILEEVSTIISGKIEAGYHSIVWDANSYASGVYFVKMVAGEFVNIQKLMLIK